MKQKCQVLSKHNLRVRVHDDIARIEVDKQCFEEVVKNATLIEETIKKLGFKYVTLDLCGFTSGSFDKWGCMKLYFECYSGISGDMIVGALLSLGADETKLREAIAGLNLNGYKLEISQITKSAIQATDFNVILDDDNDMGDLSQYLVQTNNINGLTKENVEQALNILKVDNKILKK